MTSLLATNGRTCAGAFYLSLAAWESAARRVLLNSWFCPMVVCRCAIWILSCSILLVTCYKTTTTRWSSASEINNPPVKCAITAKNTTPYRNISSTTSLTSWGTSKEENGCNSAARQIGDKLFIANRR